MCREDVRFSIPSLLKVSHMRSQRVRDSSPMDSVRDVGDWHSSKSPFLSSQTAIEYCKEY